jgi:hypothetical protein
MASTKKKKKHKVTDEKKPNATPNEIMFRKLTPIYNKIKIKKKELIPGLNYYFFENIPKELSLTKNKDSTDYVIYLDDENATIGKIKNITDKYCTIYIKDRSYSKIDLFPEQAIILKQDTKLYKKMKK